MTLHAKTNNKMINTQRQKKRRPAVLQDNGDSHEVIFGGISTEGDFNSGDFMSHNELAQNFRDLNRQELNSVLYGADNNVLGSASDQEFNSLRKNLERDVIRPQFMDYVVKFATQLTAIVNGVDTEQAERIVLNKPKDLETTAFEVEVPAEGDPERDSALKHNTAVEHIRAYHEEVTQIETDEQAYVDGKLDHLTDMQRAVIRAATGSRPGDDSKVVRAYKTLFSENAMDATKDAGG
ncbi:hypothetical protein HOD08_03970, partial [bacterium]|nr:hypothetical protein [bacterium]